MEIWKTIKEFENYQVSNLGNVKRLQSIVKYKNGLTCNHKEKILSFENINTNKNGKHYKRVTLSKNNIQKRFTVHRLVAIHFLENKDNKKCVNHIDGNPENNNVFNLEWATHSENEIHSYDVLKKINANRKLKKEEVLFIRKNAILGRGGNVIDLSIKFNVHKKTIINTYKKNYYVSIT
jgi:DNA primase catalytic subunit